MRFVGFAVLALVLMTGEARADQGRQDVLEAAERFCGLFGSSDNRMHVQWMEVCVHAYLIGHTSGRKVGFREGYKLGFLNCAGPPLIAR
jgi:hypothetical protein